MLRIIYSVDILDEEYVPTAPKPRPSWTENFKVEGDWRRGQGCSATNSQVSCGRSKRLDLWHDREVQIPGPGPRRQPRREPRLRDSDPEEEEEGILLACPRRDAYTVEDNFLFGDCGDSSDHTSSCTIDAPAPSPRPSSPHTPSRWDGFMESDQQVL